MFRLGPLRIRPEAWPPSWLGYTERWLSSAPALGVKGELTLAIERDPAAAGAPAVAMTLHELLSATRCAPGIWELLGLGLFVARYDEAKSRMDMRIASDDDDPGLVLGNALRGLAATALPARHDGLMIHACAGIHDGAGVLVAGISTAGKSTLALGFERTVYLSDDVALVSAIHEAPTLEPSPFFGAAGRRGPELQAPLRAIGVLVDKVLDPEAPSSFECVPHARAAAELLRHVARFSSDRELSDRLLALTVALTERVPVVLVKRSLRDPSDEVVRSILAVAGC
ncbi:MAG: hypothetical protein IT383_02740 [Deltaproteobacteria bacterium]|nr:hypothetical protein [Deltaproteobacteria bacterium]